MPKREKNAFDAAFTLKAIDLTKKVIEPLHRSLHIRGLFIVNKVEIYFFYFSGFGLYTGALNRPKFTVLALRTTARVLAATDHQSQTTIHFNTTYQYVSDVLCHDIMFCPLASSLSKL